MRFIPLYDLKLTLCTIATDISGISSLDYFDELIVQSRSPQPPPATVGECKDLWASHTDE
jgi:hypothetical protein